MSGNFPKGGKASSPHQSFGHFSIRSRPRIGIERGPFGCVTDDLDHRPCAAIDKTISCHLIAERAGDRCRFETSGASPINAGSLLRSVIGYASEFLSRFLPSFRSSIAGRRKEQRSKSVGKVVRGEEREKFRREEGNRSTDLSLPAKCQSFLPSWRASGKRAFSRNRAINESTPLQSWKERRRRKNKRIFLPFLFSPLVAEGGVRDRSNCYPWIVNEPPGITYDLPSEERPH